MNKEIIEQAKKLAQDSDEATCFKVISFFLDRLEAIRNSENFKRAGNSLN